MQQPIVSQHQGICHVVQQDVENADLVQLVPMDILLHPCNSCDNQIDL